jgi:hypothetical protein
VAPADHALRDAEVDDELHVGVAVRVGATRDLDELVGAADELGIGREVLGRCHHDELDRPLVAKGVVGPVADGHDGLGRRHAVVGDQDLAATTGLDVLPHVVLELLVRCLHRSRGNRLDFA